jgi:hypothetical protein
MEINSDYISFVSIVDGPKYIVTIQRSKINVQRDNVRMETLY